MPEISEAPKAPQSRIENVLMPPRYAKKVGENGELIDDINKPTHGKFRVDGKVAGKHYEIAPSRDWNKMRIFDDAHSIETSKGKMPLSDFLLKNVRGLTQLAIAEGFVTDKDADVKVQEEHPLAFLKNKNGELAIPKRLSTEQTQNLMLLIFEKTKNTTDFAERDNKKGLTKILLEEIRNNYIKLSEAGKVSDDPKNPSGIFTEEPVFEALNIACRKAVEARLEELAYRKTRVFERKGESKGQRLLNRLSIAAGINDESAGGTARKQIESLMDVFKENGSGLEFSVQIDLFMAQAFDVLVPAENRLEMKKLQMKIEDTSDYREKADLMEKLNRERQMWRMAILNHFQIERTLPGKTKIPTIANEIHNPKIFTSDERMKIENDYTNAISNGISSIEKSRKDLGGFGELDLSTANLINTKQLLEEVLPKNSGKPDVRAKRVEKALKELFANCSQMIIEGGDEILKKDTEKRDKYIKDTKLLEGLQGEQRELAKRVIEDAFATQLSLEFKLKKESERIGAPTKPTDIKFGSEINRALKGIELLYRRGVSEEIPEGKRFDSPDSKGKPNYKMIKDDYDVKHIRSTKESIPDEVYEEIAAAMSQTPVAKKESNPVSTALISEDTRGVDSTTSESKPGQEFEFFNGLSIQEQIVVTYMQTAGGIINKVRGLGISSNLDQAIGSAFVQKKDEFIRMGLIEEVVESNKTKVKIKGKEIKNIAVPTEHNFSERSNPSQLGSTNAEKLLMLDLITTIKIGESASSINNESEASEKNEFKNEVTDNLQLTRFSETSGVLGLGEDVWSSAQLLEAMKKNENIRVESNEKIIVEELSITGIDDLDILSSLSELLPKNNIFIESLNLTVDRPGELEAKPIKNFNIDTLILTTTEKGSEVNLSLIDGSCGVIEIKQGQFNISTNTVPEMISMADGDSAKASRLILTENSLAEILSKEGDNRTDFLMGENSTIQVELQGKENNIVIYKEENLHKKTDGTLGSFILVKEGDEYKLVLKPEEGGEEVKKKVAVISPASSTPPITSGSVTQVDDKPSGDDSDLPASAKVSEVSSSGGGKAIPLPELDEAQTDRLRDELGKAEDESLNEALRAFNPGEKIDEDGLRKGREVIRSEMEENSRVAAKESAESAASRAQGLEEVLKKARKEASENPRDPKTAGDTLEQTITRAEAAMPISGKESKNVPEARRSFVDQLAMEIDKQGEHGRKIANELVNQIGVLFGTHKDKGINEKDFIDFLDQKINVGGGEKIDNQVAVNYVFAGLRSVAAQKDLDSAPGKALYLLKEYLSIYASAEGQPDNKAVKDFSAFLFDYALRLADRPQGVILGASEKWDDNNESHTRSRVMLANFVVSMTDIYRTRGAVKRTSDEEPLNSSETFNSYRNPINLRNLITGRTDGHVLPLMLNLLNNDNNQAFMDRLAETDNPSEFYHTLRVDLTKLGYEIKPNEKGKNKIALKVENNKTPYIDHGLRTAELQSESARAPSSVDTQPVEEKVVVEKQKARERLLAERFPADLIEFALSQEDYQKFVTGLREFDFFSEEGRELTKKIKKKDIPNRENYLFSGEIESNPFSSAAPPEVFVSLAKYVLKQAGENPKNQLAQEIGFHFFDHSSVMVNSGRLSPDTKKEIIGTSIDLLTTFLKNHKAPMLRSDPYLSELNNGIYIDKLLSATRFSGLLIDRSGKFRQEAVETLNSRPEFLRMIAEADPKKQQFFAGVKEVIDGKSTGVEIVSKSGGGYELKLTEAAQMGDILNRLQTSDPDH
ncbi:MAG: hypothetical protein WC741_03545 [Patescibacteria group bacterium]|jgi:hypothetical protein